MKSSRWKMARRFGIQMTMNGFERCIAVASI